MVLAAGCGKPKAPVPKASVAPKPETHFEAESKGGSGTWYSEGTNRHALWEVAWNTAEVKTVNDVPGISTMHGVRGQIFQPKEAKTFRADKAVLDKNSNVLTLLGSVSVYSPLQKANLKCDKLVYDSEHKTFLGTGNVSVLTPTMTMTGIPAVKADAAFEQIASPDQFKEQDAAKQ